MWFVKRNLISFFEDGKFFLLKELIKKNKIIEEEKKEFEKKEDLESYILEQIDEYPQTYVSTLTFILNQGVVKGCSKQIYLENEIDYDNVKILCFERYSFYISLFDLQKIKNEFPFIDFLYSPLSVIDYLAKERKNRFYLMIFENYIALLAYENFIPIYSDIIELKEEKEEVLEDIEEIEEIENLDDISEEIEEDIESIDEKELEEKLDEITTGIESKILNSVQEALKEYYNKYSSDFIEKITLLDCTGIDMEIAKIIEDEVLIECEYQKLDILKILNRMSRESL
ncbi:hypothetical protein [Caminibacter sp.]